MEGRREAHEMKIREAHEMKIREGRRHCTLIECNLKSLKPPLSPPACE